MEKIALITESTADLPKEIIEKYNIKVLPLRIIYKDREYLDGVDITPEEVYESFKHELPTTSMPSMKDIDAVFSSLKADNYTHAIVVTISSGLSGTVNTMRLVSQGHPEINTFVFDSKSLTMGTGALMEYCAKLIEEGKNFEEITSLLPEKRNKIHVYFIVDTLEYLIKGGRIGRVSGTIGEFFNIKPLISIGKEDGKYYTYAKLRGKKQGVAKLLSLASEYLSKSKGSVYVMHANAKDECKNLYDKISLLPNLNDIFMSELSPVQGVHCGPGLIGIVVVEE